MASNKSVKLMSLMMLTAAIAACGGGGGGDDTAPPTAGPPAPGTPPPPPPPPPPPSGAPPAPTEATTGLSAPTLNLSTSTDAQVLIGSFVTLARQMRDAYEVADEAAAALQVAKLAPGLDGGGTSPFNCPGGGTITFAPGASPLNYTYVGCTTNGYSFIGAGVLTPTMGGYTLNIAGVQASGADAPDGTLTGSSACVTGAESNCVTTLGSFRWGYDVMFSGGLANGTHQCTCGNNQTWNVVYSDFAADSGTAYIYATNGTAVATRTSANTFSVTQTVNGVTFPAVEVPI